MDFTEETATGTVVASFAGAADFEEWERAVGFLTATGRMCDDTRQEFILLSDVLG